MNIGNIDCIGVYFEVKKKKKKNTKLLSLVSLSFFLCHSFFVMFYFFVSTVLDNLCNLYKEQLEEEDHKNIVRVLHIYLCDDIEYEIELIFYNQKKKLRNMDINDYYQKCLSLICKSEFNSRHIELLEEIEKEYKFGLFGDHDFVTECLYFCANPILWYEVNGLYIDYFNTNFEIEDEEFELLLNKSTWLFNWYKKTSNSLPPHFTLISYSKKPDLFLCNFILSENSNMVLHELYGPVLEDYPILYRLNFPTFCIIIFLKYFCKPLIGISEYSMNSNCILKDKYCQDIQLSFCCQIIEKIYSYPINNYPYDTIKYENKSLHNAQEYGLRIEHLFDNRKVYEKLAFTNYGLFECLFEIILSFIRNVK